MAQSSTKRHAKPRKTGAAQRPRRRQKAKGVGFLNIVFFMLVGVGLVLAPALSGLLFVGMLPTLIMLITDMGRFKRLRLSAMAAFNLSGVSPYAFALWRDGMGVDTLLDMLPDLTVWLVMYGAAAIGLLMLWACPVAAAAARSMINADQGANLVRQRKALIAEWGDGVTGEDAREASGSAG